MKVNDPPQKTASSYTVTSILSRANSPALRGRASRRQQQLQKEKVGGKRGVLRPTRRDSQQMCSS